MTPTQRKRRKAVLRFTTLHTRLYGIVIQGQWDAFYPVARRMLEAADTVQDVDKLIQQTP